MSRKLRGSLALLVPTQVGYTCQVPLLGIGLIIALIGGWSLTNTATLYLAEAIAPVAQADLANNQIYAYRDWQSLGKRVKRGDQLLIEAEGQWHYTPDDYHGPQGHPRFMAPSFYPVSGPGGALIGRIGEKGKPFYVGRRSHLVVNREGLLYLRINDDILSDNDGSVTVDLTIEMPPETE